MSVCSEQFVLSLHIAGKFFSKKMQLLQESIIILNKVGLTLYRCNFTGFQRNLTNEQGEPSMSMLHVLQRSHLELIFQSGRTANKWEQSFPLPRHQIYFSLTQEHMDKYKS